MRASLLLLALLVFPFAPPAAAYIETPAFAEQVGSGAMPPVAARLPDEPLRAQISGADAAPGQHGGELRTLISNARDIRYMVVYGYARLVGRDRDLRLAPDILARIENVDDRIFTLHLRRGHKWSDGHPFTSEDFRYFWEDVASNPELSPNGPGTEFLADGVLPKVEILDQVTVRYSWPTPNPVFLQAMAQASPLFIYRPAHYLKNYHRRYADSALLAAEVARARVHSWAALHNRLDNMYNNDNIAMPSLDPWINTTQGPARRYIFERNPYYHRVDVNGRQLPYIDRVIMTVTESRLIPAKSNAGESDLQARGLNFSDIMVLKQGEARSQYVTHLWPIATGAQMALYPNLNHDRPAFRAVLRDARFRRALSLGIDRHLINRSLYFGLASESNNTVLPQSELYRSAYAQYWAIYDPDQAGRLLDEMGFNRRDARGIRLMADGSPLEMIVETADQSTEQSDVLQLIAADWRRIGVGLFIKPAERDAMRARAYAGRSMMTMWAGLDTGMPTSDMGPYELAPMTQDQLQWPFWGQHYQTDPLQDERRRLRDHVDPREGGGARVEVGAERRHHLQPREVDEGDHHREDQHVAADGEKV
ncbi:MAG: peptide/nickel transport system substrate-binding protein, partial [Alphaproteobacteria bacterium]|nr:peptide/nickel transport system substrate-binding protein [Alphaproteobacteria bacterium]